MGMTAFTWNKTNVIEALRLSQTLVDNMCHLTQKKFSRPLQNQCQHNCREEFNATLVPWCICKWQPFQKIFLPYNNLSRMFLEKIELKFIFKWRWYLGCWRWTPRFKACVFSGSCTKDRPIFPVRLVIWYKFLRTAFIWGFGSLAMTNLCLSWYVYRSFRRTPSVAVIRQLDFCFLAIYLIIVFRL